MTLYQYFKNQSHDDFSMEDIFRDLFSENYSASDIVENLAIINGHDVDEELETFNQILKVEVY